ncbi:hypothetical protein PWEIH_06476 [Listeria weihenstephanensis FSL R9-0317]|uniref:hypothetical protein n=1 Tax=Listeria weihenstephanensis TaxID=1006155 RepID=UPI0003E8AC8A|nr:hypothetical protein [Listeria weihenstephanensis]EUJ39711.1 hypothetical protein PWEIH_06476 [Listeria weihenstephanensis FSL R9-0317]
MKKSLVASIIVAASLIFMYLHANPIHAQAANEVDLKPLIEQAGSGTLVLKDKKDVTYIVNAPITNVKCSIQARQVVLISRPTSKAMATPRHPTS